MTREERVECRSKNIVHDVSYRVTRKDIEEAFDLLKETSFILNPIFNIPINEVPFDVLYYSFEKQINHLLLKHDIKTRKPRYIKTWMTRKGLILEVTSITNKIGINIIPRITINDIEIRSRKDV